MGSLFNQLLGLARRILSFAGWRAVVLLALMIAAALTEGLGLLLLVPLIMFIGLAPGDTQENVVSTAISSITSSIGLTLTLDLVLIVFVLLVVIRQLVVYFAERLTADTRINYVADVRKELMATLGETSLRFLRGERLDEFTQILLTDSWRIGEAALSLMRMLSGTILILANVAVAVCLSPLLALSVLGSVTLLTLLFSNRLASVQAQGRNLSLIHNNMYRVVANYTDGLRVIKMAGSVDQMRDEFGISIDSLSAELSGFARNMEMTKMVLQIAAAIAVAAALMIAVRLFGARGPELLLLIFIAARLIPKISTINQNAHSLAHDLPAFSQAVTMLQECRANSDFRWQAGPVPVASRSIGVQGITVVANDGTGKILLDNVSLELSVQEVVAVVGPSGAGKSTLADVLSGLLRPDRGDILIDREPLDVERIVSWRMCVGYVPQSAVLWQASIRHNLNWLLAQEPTAAELERALRCAEVFEVVSLLPYGLDTIVDRREGTLSGGEQQRLAIARELLRQPQLLILDEATNALDVETEARVLENIRSNYPALTVLVIAHRATAIAKADRVVKITAGRLVAEGHDARDYRKVRAATADACQSN